MSKYNQVEAYTNKMTQQELETKLRELVEEWRDHIDGSDCRCEQTNHVLSVCADQLEAILEG